MMSLFQRCLNRIVTTAFAMAIVSGVFGQSPVTVRIDPKAPVGRMISDDFVGLSFGMRAVLPGKEETHFFSPTNTALITLFHNVGIKHLRVGGTTVEAPPDTAIPTASDIDSLFAFAHVAGVQRIIYSLRLLETNAALNYEATNVAIAKYVWSRYRPQLDCFAIGNEPDLHRVFDQDYVIKDFPSYLTEWRKFVGAIVAAIPEAKFAGPDGSGNVGFTTNFAIAECGSGLLKMVTDHFYVGGKGRDVEPERGIDSMLSAEWISRNEKRFDSATNPVRRGGCAYRLTEANDHYSGGVRDASDTFAGALWALDFLHWWVAHEIVGVDFHNTMWVANDVIAHDKGGELRINPKGYGLKAFAIGGHGSPEHVTIDNARELNLTAYSFRDGGQHFVTLINKEHGVKARSAAVTISGVGAGDAMTMVLQSPNGVAAKTGITLGGASITSDTIWNGRWKKAKINRSRECVVRVVPGTAIIVKLTESK